MCAHFKKHFTICDSSLLSNIISRSFFCILPSLVNHLPLNYVAEFEALVACPFMCECRELESCFATMAGPSRLIRLIEGANLGLDNPNSFLHGLHSSNYVVRVANAYGFLEVMVLV